MAFKNHWISSLVFIVVVDLSVFLANIYCYETIPEAAVAIAERLKNHTKEIPDMTINFLNKPENLESFMGHLADILSFEEDIITEPTTVSCAISKTDLYTFPAPDVDDDGNMPCASVHRVSKDELNWSPLTDLSDSVEVDKNIQSKFEKIETSLSGCDIIRFHDELEELQKKNENVTIEVPFKHNNQNFTFEMCFSPIKMTMITLKEEDLVSSATKFAATTSPSVFGSTCLVVLSSVLILLGARMFVA